MFTLSENNNLLTKLDWLITLGRGKKHGEGPELSRDRARPELLQLIPRADNMMCVCVCVCLCVCILPASRSLLWYTLLWCRQVVFCPPHTMQASSCCFEPKMESQPGFCLSQEDTDKYFKKKLQFDLVGRVDSQHSSVTHFLWRARATSELSFCFCLLLHGHLEPSNRNSARLALSPSLICSSLSFSPSHKHLLWEEKRSDSGPQERRIGRRVVSVNVKMPKQRARRMSWMVYGVWRSDPLSSPGFHLPALQSKPIKGEVPRQESGNLGDL